MLWLALHFPLLPLEALPLRPSPSALVGRGRVLYGDRAAAAAGIAGGLRLSTALGLCPGLAVFERDAALEGEALTQLACWAGSLTPTLSLRPPAALLLEIGGCLRLFGGAQAIVEAALAGCAAQSYSASWAVAPTPLGALWLARAGTGAIHGDWPALHDALDCLPCTIPGWPAEAESRLESFGLKCLGDLQALPGASLRRRLGNGPVDEWRRARGELPDPQTPFVFPERFAAGLELPSRVEHAEALAFAGQRLLAALAGWLRERQRLVRVCTLQLTHDDGSHSELALRFAEPVADEARCLRLLRERLAVLRLSAPVEALKLRADETVARPGDSGALFDRAPAGEGAPACLERLRARLGEGAVRVLGEKADYRPECTTLFGDPDFGLFSPSTLGPAVVSMVVGGGSGRPLWLLPVPQVLAERGGAPHWHGPLKLLSRAERLESGWWDEGEAGAAGDQRRDYFVARNPRGETAWIFRDRQGWYLHGLFS